MRLDLKNPWFATLASAVLLTSILGWMVVDRVRLLQSGREIVLAIRPVDPRDLFKGDYARLGFDISRLDPALVGEPAVHADRRDASARPETVYVTLEEQPDRTWKPVAAGPARPTRLAANQVVIRGQTRPYSRTLVTYGLERYFVPEGTGHRIEAMARASQLQAIVVVDAKGRAAIKGLIHEGRRIYEEPLF